MAVKNPTTYAQQILLLRSRGLIIDDEDAVLDFLKHVSYYRATGYLLPFKRQDDTYRTGTTFSKIANIYAFDCKLRNLLADVIGESEIAIRSTVSYYLAHKYGALGYRDPLIYNNKHRHDNFEKTLKDIIKRAETTLNSSSPPQKIQRTVSYLGDK
jgi:abortive infection bacteriophage resistance protein